MPVPLEPTGTRARLRILVVDDDEAIAAILALLLGLLGFEARAAYDGAAALAVLSAGPLPDALLLDIRLPDHGPDGIALARAIRARRDWDRVAVILMTAEAYDEQATLEATGADAFVRKPLPGGDVLGELIHKCVTRRNHRWTQMGTDGRTDGHR
jgi:two-component system OmpR family response regulator